MKKHSPGARLQAAAGYARNGSFIADIGTDHAYLPVYLLESGISSGAVATDINRGPLDRAAVNIAAAGLADRVVLKLTDGLYGVEEYSPRDIFILGMGGELIARILADSDYIKNEDIRLVLQPMTRQAALRRFLADNGFCVEDELLVREDGRIYQLICAHYSGISYEPNELELMVGAINLRRGGELLQEYCERLARELDASARGKLMGRDISGADADKRLAQKLRSIGRIQASLSQKCERNDHRK